MIFLTRMWKNVLADIKGTPAGRKRNIERRDDQGRSSFNSTCSDDVKEGTSTKSKITQQQREELQKSIEKFISIYIPFIMERLDITKEEFDPDKQILVFMEGGPEKVTGSSGWGGAKIRTFETVKVKLFIGNIRHHPASENFVYNLMHSLAHEMKHVQQIKQGKSFEGYLWHEENFEAYQQQPVEREANAFADEIVEWLKQRTLC
jgi:hypothetical protein